jgi:hypothetical protein
LLTWGPKIREITQRFSGVLSTLNAPDGAPPDLPRAIVQFPDSLLQIAPARLHLALEPPSHVASSYDEALDFAFNRARPLFDSLMDPESYQWTGIVVVLAYPQNGSNAQTSVDASRPFFERLTTLSWDTELLATFELKAGLKQGSFFRNYVVSGYETRQVVIAPNSPDASIQVDIRDSALIELGVNITIDINNKPADEKLGIIPDLIATFKEHEAAFLTLPNDLNLVGVI